MEKEWFSSWFDTPYYHILYKNRDDKEAQKFMRNITDFIGLDKSSHIADLPCGKGRHSVYLNSLGYKVTAGDLSKQSIEHAKQFENNTLSFEVWDMRTPLENKYDAIFNLFTSFGYFDDDGQDLQVLESICNGLRKEGYVVLDYLNVEKVAANLVRSEVKQVDGIDFHIKREIKNGFIYKYIKFFADGIEHAYQEQVKLIDLPKFQYYFSSVGLEIIHTFGDYDLNEFNAKESNRLILVAK